MTELPKFPQIRDRTVPLNHRPVGFPLRIQREMMAPARPGKEPPMTEQNDNIETPPAVEPTHYDGPTKSEQRTWIQGTNLLILAVAVAFVAIILIYVLTR